MDEEKNEYPCPNCEKRAKEHGESEEVALAILVALVPILTLTLFSNMGIL